MKTPETIEQQNYFFRQLLFLALLIVMGLVIFARLSSLVGAFLGASTLYILFRKPLFNLTEKRKWKRWIAALALVIIISILFLGALFGIFELILSEIQNFNIHGIIEKGNELIAKINSLLRINLFSENIVDRLGPMLGQGAGILVNATYNFAVGIVFMILLLYFMLANGRKMESSIKRYLPFKGESRRMLMHDTTAIIYNNAMVMPVTMLAQGITAAVIYWLFGLDNIVLLSFITALCGLIPMIGTIIVSVPLGVNLILQGEMWQGIALIACGIIIIANIDNLFRILFNQRATETHPLIIIFGVLIGIPVFGFWGIIFGPLLISIFLLLIKIYYLEYKLFSTEGKDAKDAKEEL